MLAGAQGMGRGSGISGRKWSDGESREDMDAYQVPEPQCGG